MLRQPLPPSAAEYARAQRQEIQLAVAAVSAEWARMNPEFDLAWSRIAANVEAITRTAQTRIIAGASAYVPAVLEETGQSSVIAHSATPQTTQLVGLTGDGAPTDYAAGFAPIKAKQAVEGGATSATALREAGIWLTATVGTVLSDTGRAAEGLGIYSRPVAGYVRMLTPPSCARCAILAGKWFRKNQGFQRHPRCDCRHIPVSEAIAGDLTLDPQAYYDSLDEAGRIKLAGSRANYLAIEDGADLTQIVNAYSRTAGMRFAQTPTIKSQFGNKYTTSGSTRRARAAQQQAGLRTNGRIQPRLMPETIVNVAKDHEDRLRLLRLYGWIADDTAAAAGRRIFAEQRRVSRNARDRARRAERAAASGGGTTPPRVPPSGGSGGSGGPSGPFGSDPGDAARSRAYWQARQDAMENSAAATFRGEVLEPHEVEFVERFTGLGHAVRWTPRDRAAHAPTNDFEWLDNGGLAIELKSTKARYSSIRGRILDATSRAAKQGVVKENFIIDIASAPLTDTLRDELAGYNIGRRQHRIARLWVMSRGELTEIPLRT